MFRLVRRSKLAGVHGDRWTVRLRHVRFARRRQAWRGAGRWAKLLPCAVVHLERAKKLAPETVIERFVPVVRSKNASPTWSDDSGACPDTRGLP